MKNVISLIALSILLLVPVGIHEAFAATLTSISNGSFTSSSTWSPNQVPQNGDTLIIKSGFEVTLSGDVFLSNINLEIEEGGKLIIDTGAFDAFFQVSSSQIINRGIIQIEGPALGEGILSLIDSSTLDNYGMIIINGDNQNSAILGSFSGSTINNQCSGTITVNGGPTSNSGKIQVGSVLNNFGVIELNGGFGLLSGELLISGGGTVNNFNTINENGGPGSSSGMIRNFGTLNNTPQECSEFLVAGKVISIEQTSLLLAGAQSFSWMIPVILSGIGIGLFVASRKFEKD